MPTACDGPLPDLVETISAQGWARATYRSLGIALSDDHINELARIAGVAPFSASAAALTERISKSQMRMVQTEDALRVGRFLVEPLVRCLFAASSRALRSWNLYAINVYEEGGCLGPHQDSVGATVLIVTFSGRRKLDLYDREEEYETFRSVHTSLTVERGDIVLLDGEFDPGHSVECIKGPSIAAVLDVPELLR